MTGHLKKSLVMIIFSLLFISGQKSYSQLETDFFKAGISDGMTLMEAYITPYANAFGAGFNSAWYNTAKTHRLGGFDVTLSVSAGFVPDNAKSFDLNDLSFSRLGLVNPTGNTIAPTIAGAKEPGPALHVLEEVPGNPGTEIELVNFDSPEGIGWGIIPAPILQVGIGLPLASEVKIRYIPNTPVDEGSLRLIGGGLMKSITEHIKAFDMLPVNISAFGGYSKLSGTLPVSIQPDNYINYISYSEPDFNNQSFNVDVTAWNISLIGSVDIPMLSGYAGLGYSKTVMNMNLDGSIPLPTIDPAISTEFPVYTDEGVIENVDEVKIENFSGLRFNIGGRLKLGLFTIHADYTYANYNVLTAGLGISFR